MPENHTGGERTVPGHGTDSGDQVERERTDGRGVSSARTVDTRTLRNRPAVSRPAVRARRPSPVVGARRGKYQRHLRSVGAVDRTVRRVLDRVRNIGRQTVRWGSEARHVVRPTFRRGPVDATLVPPLRQTVWMPMSVKIN